ncbi:MAG: hypothetical protein WA191_03470, partial [Telluria sp.]
RGQTPIFGDVNLPMLGRIQRSSATESDAAGQRFLRKLLGNVTDLGCRPRFTSTAGLGSTHTLYVRPRTFDE